MHAKRATTASFGPHPITRQTGSAKSASISAWCGEEKFVGFFRQLVSQGPADGSFSAAALGGFKAGLKARGVITHSATAPPMTSFGEEEEEKVKAIMHDAGYL